MNRIKIVMEQKGKTQTDIADAIGISQQAVSQFANNQTQPKLSTLFEIADFLGVSPKTLIGDGSEIQD